MRNLPIETKDLPSWIGTTPLPKPRIKKIHLVRIPDLHKTVELPTLRVRVQMKQWVRFPEHLWIK